MPLYVSSTRAHRQEVKILLYSLWNHHTYRWPSLAHLRKGRPPRVVMIPEAFDLLTMITCTQNM